jgi:uncharacterized protein
VHPHHIASRYNFCVPVSSGALLYNLSSGRLVRLSRGDGEELARLLSAPVRARVDATAFQDAVWSALLDGGFVVDESVDEVAEIKERFWSARRSSPIVVTLTVTQDCNLRCFYCYEDRTDERLESGNLPEILERLDASLARAPTSSVHVDWYGGEPLLAADFIECASVAIQDHVAKRGRGYSASIISNGTRWPSDPAAFVRRHAIREVQISFDGNRLQHDKYRAYRKETASSSFDEAVRVVDALVSVCKVAIRLNIDARSAPTVGEFLDFVLARKWLVPPNRGVLQPARLTAFSKRSAFMKDAGLSVTEFERIKRDLIKPRLGPGIRIEEAETLDGFPRPRSSVCAALGDASFVVGADALEYRCGLQVGEAGRNVGPLVQKKRRLPLAADAEKRASDDTAFWRDFDPTERPRCPRCSFLPVCWGGCPKGHLEGNQHAIDEQGRYWRENLARLIAAGAGESEGGAFAFDEAVQFRS